jgi:hypothetical protein
MEVNALSAEHEGLARYRITIPQRPGRYAILEVPADAEDPVGLVELFVGSHLRLLDWASIDDVSDDAGGPQPEPEGDYTADMPDQLRHPIMTG